MSDLDNRQIMSENLNRLMKERGINRKQLSIDTGFSYTTLSSWINGKVYPRVDKIDQLAQYFGVDSTELTTKHYQYTDEQRIDKIIDRIVGFNGHQVTDKDRTILKDLIISYLKNQENDESHL